MNEQYIIEIEKNKEMIHQGDIFDQCSIGGDKNHYYQSGDLKNNELLIREIAGVYNIIPNSSNWKLNGVPLEEKKYYLLGRKNKLVCGKYTIIIKKIVDKSTGGLELDTDKKDVRELIGEKQTSDNIYGDTDIYNTPKKSKIRSSHQGYLKKLGFFANITSIFFNICLFYLSSWIIPYIFPGEELNLIFTKLDSTLVEQIQKINPQFIIENKINIFQSAFSELNILSKHSPLLDSLFIPIFHGIFIFLFIKIALAFVLGRPFPWIFLGVSIDGNIFTKRLKAPLFELLSIILLPLNFYNLGGLLPFKSLPTILLRIDLCRTSSLLGIFGPFLLLLSTLIILSTPIIYQMQAASIKFISEKLPNSKHKDIDKKDIVFQQTSISIPLLGKMSIDQSTKNGNVEYKVISDKFQKSIQINEGPTFISWNHDLSSGNPISFITQPVHALKNIKYPIPNGNAEKFNHEKIEMMKKILELKIEKLPSFIFANGPFIAGAYFLLKEIHNSLELLQGDVYTYWVKNSGIKIIFVNDSKIYIADPLSQGAKMIEISSISKKDLSLFGQKFLSIQSPHNDPITGPNILEKSLIEFEKIDFKNLSMDHILNKIKQLLGDTGPSFIKKLQNQQKELTDSLKKATKSKKDALKEVDQE